MSSNKVLESIEMPKIRFVENDFLFSNKNIIVFIAPNLQYLGDYSFHDLLSSRGIKSYGYSDDLPIRLVKNIIGSKNIKINLENKINYLNNLKYEIKHNNEKEDIKRLTL